MRLLSFRAALITSVIFIITIGGLLTHYATQPMTAEALEDGEWIATSKSAIDRAVCRWFGLCGIAHVWQKSRWRSVPGETYSPPKKPRNSSGFWDSGDEDERLWTTSERILREIPQYVIDHAPYVHLYSGEEFWPSDIGDHLVHTTPHVNYTPVDVDMRRPNLSNLDNLNKYGIHTFLKSDDNVEQRPEWLGSKYNIPEASHEHVPESVRFPGRQGHWRWHPFPGIREDPDFDKWWSPNTTTPDGHKIWQESASGQAEARLHDYHSASVFKSDLKKRTTREPRAGGRSDAPVIMLVVDKGNDVVDAFWFYFYSYNLGNKVFNIRFGDHVGDWEHTCIRFYKGKPKAIFLSEHDGGAAYAWEAVEKIGQRPVTYSATGTHAMYATPGVHTYVLPFGLLHDITDRGPLWDPVLNMKSYTYDYKKDLLRASTLNPTAPTSWFYLWGHWGDKFYPLDDPRQYRFAGQYHYVNGPLGPRFKSLDRALICQIANRKPCHIQYWIQERIYLSSGPLAGKGDEHDGNSDQYLGKP
ncbi:uncharacterized protein PV09_03429 [Verruconis gallopava]|uniref:Vacuolar protein sorting-associated protein 62 n=1 Tax=Verruconis gallopava TaxID=253628 RepID=A0A0D1XS61_9PEZI|nr:uncharacterized protein PV09_03429 [Verruconis gallopava]KIW05551.1 hypothetical protein PV09_03429 [Verruconis gallopava]